MVNSLTVGSLTAKSGEEVVAEQSITIDGNEVRFPVFVINGAQDGPTLAVTAGIHGAEYASVAAALEVGQKLDPAQLSGQVIIVPVANMPAFRARSIYVCPLDGVNLNRAFPGKADGGATEQLAYWLFEEVFRKADYYVDMHGGDLIEALVPFTIFQTTGNQKVDELSLEMAKVFGIQYLVNSKSGGSTFAEAARAGIPAILTEAGGQGIWKREDVQAHIDGLNRLMRYYKMTEGPAPETVPTTILEDFHWLTSEHEGYYYPQVEIGEKVSKGQSVGYVTDYSGKRLQEAVAPADGMVLFLVTSLAINKGDPLLSIGA